MKNPDLPVKFHDLPAELYPFTIEAYHPETKEIVWTVRVELPPPGEKVALYIPPLKDQLGHPVAVRVLFADGSVEDGGPVYVQ